MSAPRIRPSIARWEATAGNPGDPGYVRAGETCGQGWRWPCRAGRRSSCTPLTFIRVTSKEYIFRPQPMGPMCEAGDRKQHTQPTRATNHATNTRNQHTQPTHETNTRNQHTQATHASNTRKQHTQPANTHTHTHVQHTHPTNTLLAQA